MSARAAAPAAGQPHPCQIGTDLPETREGILEVAGPLALFHGGTLHSMRIAWRLTGVRGAPANTRVVAALGGISAHRAVFSEGDATTGWWDSIAGPGCPLDSRQCSILGFDFLGGSGETTGPLRGETFPSVSTFDQATVLARLLDHLAIPSLHAIVGASYGGMVALAFAQRFARSVGQLVVISGAHRPHPLATAWRCVQREIVRRALNRGEGAAGLEVARALAMATYRSGEEFAARFPAAVVRKANGAFSFPVAEYLFARGASYAAKYSAEAFLCLSESIDLHSVDPSAIRTPTLLIGVRQDQLVPPADLAELASGMSPHARRVELSSPYGHDAFLKESAQLAPLFRSNLFDTTLETSRD